MVGKLVRKVFKVDGQEYFHPFRSDRENLTKKLVVYYESLKRELKTKTTYGYRCDERLQTNVKESTRLGCTPLCAELEHLKIETRLTSETSVSEMGEYASVML